LLSHFQKVGLAPGFQLFTCTKPAALPSDFNSNNLDRPLIKATYFQAVKKVTLYLSAVLYVGAGINHLIHPATYLKIMPPWLSRPYAIVILSGLFEIILGLLLIPAGTRRVAAWGIIALLVAVFPANIQMMINYRQESNPHLWLAVLRLPLQFVLIWWAYLFTKPLAEKAQRDKG
jgi:uncharacterized membrane protein